MKVGISGYVGNRLTGIGRVLMNVVGELAGQHPGNDYYLFKNRDFDAFDPLEAFPNVHLIDYPVSKESALGNILWHQSGFQKLLHRHGCDVAFIPNFSLLLWKKVPTVVAIHDLIEYNVPGKFGPLRMFYRKRICDPLMAKRSDAVITVSESSKEDIVRYLGVRAGKIRVAPNASDPGVFRKYTQQECAQALGRYGLAYKSYLLFVGTIDYPGKNVKSVIDAYVHLRKEGLFGDRKLVIAGKNGYRAETIFSLVRESGFQDDIVFTGYVPDADLGPLVSGALETVYLSYYEGFGLPVLESMACGTPVICSDTSSFPELAGDLDICVPPDDIGAIARKMVSFADPDGYDALSAAMYNRSSAFSWERTARIYDDVFSSLL